MERNQIETAFGMALEDLVPTGAHGQGWLISHFVAEDNSIFYLFLSCDLVFWLLVKDKDHQVPERARLNVSQAAQKVAQSNNYQTQLELVRYLEGLKHDSAQILPFPTEAPRTAAA